jgi:DUF3011 family protein/ricin-type beta-trefoil lectin protein
MTNKKWRILAPAALCCILSGQGGFTGPGRYEITNLKSGRTLELDRNDQTTVIQYSSRGSENQTWDIRPAGRGYFYLRNGMNGYALDAGGGGRSEWVRGTRFNGGPSQQWRIEPGKDGNALIISQFGRTLDVPDGSARDGLQIQLYDLNGDSNQRFLLHRVGGGRDWDDRRDRDDRRDFDRGRDDRPTQGGLVCSSNNGERVYCGADTRGGVQLIRQISGSPCEQGRTWGWDQRGVWVDRGCRAEFAINPPPRIEGQRLSCSSNHGERVYCQVDTRGLVVRMSRQISGSACVQGQTWDWDRRGIWVDRGCRAEFVLLPDR